MYELYPTAPAACNSENIHDIEMKFGGLVENHKLIICYSSIDI